VEWAEIYARLLRDRDDGAAWNALETNVRPWVRPAFWQLGWHVVDDAVADTCCAAVLAIERARGPATFSKFVYGHFLNVRRRVLASRQVHASLDDFDPPAPAEAHPADERLPVLRACLETLPARDRRAVELRYFEESSAEQIASALGVSVVNARRIVFNGLARLRACVASRWSAVQHHVQRREATEDAAAR